MPVIWQEDGSEVLVHVNTLAAVFHNGLASFTVDMECDQSGRAPIVVRFHLGRKNDLRNLMATREDGPIGHPIIVGRWARPLQDAIWFGMLDLVSASTSSSEAEGIGADEGHLWIRTDGTGTTRATHHQSKHARRMLTISDSGGR